MRAQEHNLVKYSELYCVHLRFVCVCVDGVCVARATSVLSQEPLMLVLLLHFELQSFVFRWKFTSMRCNLCNASKTCKRTTNTSSSFDFVVFSFARIIQMKGKLRVKTAQNQNGNATGCWVRAQYFDSSNGATLKPSAPFVQTTFRLTLNEPQTAHFLSHFLKNNLHSLCH